MKRLKLFTKRHSSTLLSIGSGIGVIVTTILAIKATPKAMKLIEEERESRKTEETLYADNKAYTTYVKPDLTPLETVKVAWKPYIPTGISLATTLVCIFGNNYLNTKRQAAIIAVYSQLQNMYRSFVNKTNELYPDNHIQEDIIEENYDHPMSLLDDKLLFFDFESCRYFESSMADVLKAEETLNSEFAAAGWVNLNEFYEFLGLPKKAEFDDYGWVCDDQYYELKFSHKITQIEDGPECYILTMETPPKFFI